MAKNIHLRMMQLFSTFKMGKLVFDLQMGQILQFKISPATFISLI
jgi:hypothetical protein